MHCNNLKLLCSVVMFVLWYTYMCPCSYVIIQISDEWHFCKRELYWSPQTDIVGKELCNSMDLHFTDFSGDLLFNLSRWHKCIVWALPGRQAGKYAEVVSLLIVGKEIFLCCPGPSCSLMWSFSITLRTKGRVTIPNRKNSKRPSIPPSFSENYIAIFLSWIRLHICKEVCFVLIFLNTIVEKNKRHILNPEIILLY